MGWFVLKTLMPRKGDTCIVAWLEGQVMKEEHQELQRPVERVPRGTQHWKKELVARASRWQHSSGEWTP